jgi:membrane protein DedA with SNARE-associated domain/rhodanese-related sulfurtransferase
VIFLNVLLEQLGLPLPAVPTLIVAGALAADHRLPGGELWALVVAACLIADSAWYVAGRVYGGRVMSLICRISLTPDICVSQTQARFERWGAKALIAAKFVPGLSMIAPPLAGATRMPFARFAAFAAAGAILWSGSALLVGVLLKAQIERLLPRVTGVGGAVVGAILLLLGAYIGFKWWERRRFYAALSMARISVTELHDQMQGEVAPLVLDVRSPTAQALDTHRIPGALQVPMRDVVQHVGTLPRDREVILYCSCPNEASAAQAARLLMNRGFVRVRPLLGGLDAWIAAGYPVEGILAAGGDVAPPALVPQPTP